MVEKVTHSYWLSLALVNLAPKIDRVGRTQHSKNAKNSKVICLKNVARVAHPKWLRLHHTSTLAAQRKKGTTLKIMKTPKPSAISKRSENIVQAQLDAYNSRDLDAWLATYSEDAQQLLLHAGELAIGHDAIRKRMEERFNDAKLHAQLLHRIVMDNIVVDHELVTRTFPDGLGKVEMVCIYEVDRDKIVKATFAIGQAHSA
ncbi:nuclear transport factor 2 family protein [Undibacterium sp. SXout7W]|uniref:nuclear transport factor 2 family protein n=1 Tax=Undibacterium sp. SXout7W TaxID=3413049 RepID=UPI003BEFE99F